MKTKFIFNPFTSNFDAVTSELTPGEVVGGTPYTFAGFDNTGALETLPSWGISNSTTGADFNVTLNPGNISTTRVVNNFVTTITPSGNLTALGYQGYQNYIYLNGPNDHYDTVVSNNGIQTSDTGYHGNIRILNSSLSLGDGTNVSTSGQSDFINSYMQVQANHTSQSLNSINMYVQVDGDVTNNVSLINAQANINSSLSSGSGLNGLLIGGTVAGDIQFYTGVNVTHNFNASAVANSIQTFRDDNHVLTGSSIQDYTSASLTPNIDSGSTIVDSFRGINLNPNINATMPTGSVSLISGGGSTSSAMANYNGISLSPQLNSGTSLSNNYTGIQDSVIFRTGSAASGLTSLALTPSIESGVTLTDVRGLQISPQINSNITNLSLASLFANGTGTHTNVTGLNIDLSAVNSTNRRQGINLNGGTINFNSINATASSLGVDGANFIVPTLTVSPGSPITGTTFIANNFSSLFDIQDDFAAGAIPGTGLVGIGFVGQLQVSAGKTLDAMSWALAGSQVGGAGTITDYTMFDALGAIPVGTTTITNSYAFRGRGFISGADITNAWGISIEDAAAENYLEKSLAIGTVSHKVTSAGTGLEILTKDLVLDGGDQYITAMSANGVVTNDTSGKLISVAPGTAGNVLTSSGGAWVSAPNAGGSSTPVIAAIYTATAQITAGGGILKYDTGIVDTDAAYSTLTGVFTAPRSDYYQVSWAATSIARSTQYAMRVNGVIYQSGVFTPGATSSDPASVAVFLNLGDTVDIINNTLIGELTTATPTDNVLSIVSLSGSTPLSTSSPLTTKGDIWGFSTTDSRVPVGTNGQFLVADSTQATGVKWATPVAAVPIMVSYTNQSQTIANTANVVYGNLVRDTNSAYNSTTGVFTAPVTGTYSFGWTAAATGGQVRTDLVVNSIVVASALFTAGATAAAQGYHVVYMAVNDTAAIVNNAGGSFTTTATASDNRLTILSYG